MIGNLLEQEFARENAEPLKQYLDYMAKELGLPAVHSHKTPQSDPLRKKASS